MLLSYRTGKSASTPIEPLQSTCMHLCASAATAEAVIVQQSSRSSRQCTGLVRWNYKRSESILAYYRRIVSILAKKPFGIVVGGARKI